ncbi:SGNH/GDSL hydrolase family protein [Algoriphagus yeomjeoni]|uniref:GDSL-like lipase/acylhydrolase family protein n=1 Tax=Algoriphagus yeomjeoni TaxID=291403 RepID=A0A327NZX8_9BACT|nr:SGNH/GDSL hydrolase family protein [Algoriphagus yeomjeoni]RAI85540.1 GDSL-like lipase/acylhydrolase family protein [Algoriphagus yeomjeoni]
MGLISKRDIKSFFTITVPMLVIMLVLVEIILWFVAPVADPFEKYKNAAPLNNQYIESQFPKKVSYTFEIESDLPLMDSSATFTTNNMGFRGDSLISPKPDNEYRIFLVGGSTTENLFIDDYLGFERQVQEKLQAENPTKSIKVYNAGKSGDASPDHLAMLGHRLVHLNPDLIVLFPGINDLNRLAAGYDYLHYPVKSTEVVRNWKVDLKFFLSNFQLVRRLINVMNPEEESARKAIFLSTNYKDKVKEVQSLPLEPSLPEVDISIYKRNIESFVGICKSQGIDLLLLTQTFTWDSQQENNLSNSHWMVGIGDKRYPEEVLAGKLSEMNQSIIDLADKDSVNLLDLESLIPKTNAYFYDDCHFNKGGIAFSTDLITSTIQKTYFTN